MSMDKIVTMIPCLMKLFSYCMMWHFRKLSYWLIILSSHCHIFFLIFLKNKGGWAKPKYNFQPPYHPLESNPGFGRGYNCTTTNPTTPLGTHCHMLNYKEATNIMQT